MVSHTGVGWQHTGPQQPDEPQQLEPQQPEPQPPQPPQPEPQHEDPQQPPPPQPPPPQPPPPQPQQALQQEPQQPQQDPQQAGWQQHSSQQSCSWQQVKQSPGQHPMVQPVSVQVRRSVPQVWRWPLDSSFYIPSPGRRHKTLMSALLLFTPVPPEHLITPLFIFQHSVPQLIKKPHSAQLLFVPRVKIHLRGHRSLAQLKERRGKGKPPSLGSKGATPFLIRAGGAETPALGCSVHPFCTPFQEGWRLQSSRVGAGRPLLLPGQRLQVWAECTPQAHVSTPCLCPVFVPGGMPSVQHARLFGLSWPRASW